MAIPAILLFVIMLAILEHIPPPVIELIQLLPASVLPMLVPLGTLVKEVEWLVPVMVKVD